MAGKTVNGSGNGARSGAQTLLLLSTPINVLILRALEGGPKQQAELRSETGSPAQTTLRTQLKRLHELGVVEKQRRNRFPGVLEYELTPVGRDLLFVVGVLERWLGSSPEGPLPIGGNAAKAAIKALAGAWSTTMLRVLAAGPLSLTELDGVISSLSYPSLERRLAALRLAGLVEARRGNGRGTPYAIADWLRLGAAPLASAARWEQRHTPRTAPPLARLDIEAVFLLAAPTLRTPEELSGTCRLAAEFPSANGHSLAGVTVTARDGTVESCTTNLRGHPEAWALGSTSAWLEALTLGTVDGLELGGDRALARALVDGLHETLFSTNRPPPLTQPP